MKNIILIGYMGSGKTTVGRWIARRSGRRAVDTDELIEQQQKKTIRAIFDEDGEQAFRDMETALLEQMIADGTKGMVISTGGGMPLRAENRQLLSHLGKVVYLKASPRTIYDRIKGDTARPLLQCADPMERIKEMLTARAALYEEAAMLVVDVDDLRQSEAAIKILEKCNEG